MTMMTINFEYCPWEIKQWNLTELLTFIGVKKVSEYMKAFLIWQHHSMDNINIKKMKKFSNKKQNKYSAIVRQQLQKFNRVLLQILKYLS